MLTLDHRKRAYPSACGMTSCFKSSLNAPSTFDETNAFQLNADSLVYSSTRRYFKLISFDNATCVRVVTSTIQ